VFEKFFSLFYIISTQTSHIYKKLDTKSCFAKLREISNLFSFFLYTLYSYAPTIDFCLYSPVKQPYAYAVVPCFTTKYALTLNRRKFSFVSRTLFYEPTRFYLNNGSARSFYLAVFLRRFLAALTQQHGLL
jgi:hypothetical protein